ncbi:putative ran guanine nucleotide release factor [Diplonema papillatum]|nr:putative ran guanine nucleotide release factor [Diplonema papillatum]
MYGGAMEMSIPASFVDTSVFRQLPDHQEVWADMDTNRSIILEILEPVEQSHEESARYHFNELAKANGCTPADARVLECGRLDLPNFSTTADTIRILVHDTLKQPFRQLSPGDSKPPELSANLH